MVPGEGDEHKPGEGIAPGFLTILDSSPAKPARTTHGTGRRTALARWLTDEGNPLVARVMVNRLWHHHFRRGLVATPNDVGRQSPSWNTPSGFKSDVIITMYPQREMLVQKTGGMTALLFAARDGQIELVGIETDRFNTADKDRDGSLSMKEYLNARAADFDRADTDHDGTLTQGEVSNAK